MDSEGQTSGGTELSAQGSNVSMGTFLAGHAELIPRGGQHQLHVLQDLCGVQIQRPTAPLGAILCVLTR